MKEWSFASFQEKVRGKKHFGFMVGKSLVGKSTVAGYMAKALGYHVIDMKAEAARLKEAQGPDFEGEVPMSEVEEVIL